jgi:Lysylphosphatidylglycerol synthase TM region
VALDRMLDLAGLVFGLALLSGLQALPGSVGTLLRGLSFMLLFAGIFLLLFLSRGKAFIAQFSNSLARLPWLAKRLGELSGVIEETEHLRHSRTWIRLLLLQLFIVAFEVFTVGIVLRSLPLTVVLPSWAGLQVLMFTTIGFAMPLLPGATGSLQVAYIVAMRPWGVAIPQALAFSLLAQVGHILVVLGHGGTALLIQAETRSSGEAGLS